VGTIRVIKSFYFFIYYTFVFNFYLFIILFVFFIFKTFSHLFTSYFWRVFFFKQVVFIHTKLAFTIKNVDVSICGGVPLDLFIDILEGLQHLDSAHCSFQTFHNFLTSKETRFVKELKMTSKWTNMLDERGDFNSDGDDETILLQENVIGLNKRKLILNLLNKYF